MLDRTIEKFFNGNNSAFCRWVNAQADKTGEESRSIKEDKVRKWRTGGVTSITMPAEVLFLCSQIEQGIIKVGSEDEDEDRRSEN